MIMLGDETWIRLFPGRFTRQDGVSSFYVKDSVEVDFNVSRHLEAELAASDWDLLILHYLGVDHIGHIGGRNSALMAPKLKEMDDVIRMICMHAVMRQNDVDKRTLLVVVSDHGMTDRGNHGGSSDEETDCLALFVGLQVKPADTKMVGYRTINQVDIGTTLSLLFGLPIPKNSVGVLIQEVFDQMTDEQRLRAMELNSWQLLWLLQAHLPGFLCENSYYIDLSDAQSLGINKSIGSVKERLHQLFLKAMNLHNSWKFLKGSNFVSKDTDQLNLTVEAYHGFLSAASEWLSHAATDEPVIMMLSGVFMMAFSCVLLLGLLLMLFKENRQKQHPYQMKFFRYSWNIDEIFVLLGILVHVFSLGSSSFVEEEQYTWHFLTSTLYMIFLFMRVQSFVGRQTSKASKTMGEQNHDSQKPARLSLTSNSKVIGRISFMWIDGRECISICAVLTVLICMRVLKSWHQGGVNWTHLADISKLLEEAGTFRIKSFRIASLVLVISLSCLTLCLSRSGKCYLGMLIVSQSISALLVFLHIMDYQTHLLTPSSYNLNLFFLLYGSLSVFLLLALASPWFLPSHRLTRSCETKINMPTTEMQMESLLRDIRNSTYIIGVTYTTSWCLLQLLLQQPTNAFPVLLLFLQILASMIYFSSEVSKHKPWVEVAALYFMGMTGHFGLGNSNSLATIDVAGAFKGIFGQSTLLAGIMMFIITYASPLLHLFGMVLWISMKAMIHPLVQQASDLSCILRKMLDLPCLLLLVLNSVSLTGFSIILLIMRNHLFIWSVFSPKYMYVCTSTLCVYIGLLLVVATMFYICTILSYRARNNQTRVICTGNFSG
uniref:GPI ethanolamine phosphate transferase 2 n=1 Tax=Anthurium amnicola TaxID=1678845 RepID=A0A1D1XEH9_9ARAE